MRVLLLIDHFGSGGAQRQIVYLARGLKDRGHVVEMFIYYPQYDFFRGEIVEADIQVHTITKGRGFSFKVLYALRQCMRRGQYDGVISFLSSPNIYAELARITLPSAKVFACERSSYRDDRSRLVALARLALHAVAARVVSNSHEQANWLRQCSWLRNKVETVYNGLPIGQWMPLLPPNNPAELRLLIIGRVGPEKNGLTLLKALALFYQRYGVVPTLRWAGKRDASSAGEAYFQEMDRQLAQLPEVKARWEWLGERSDVLELLDQHHALIHPSLYEGLPNVVCEALAAGRPVLASAVCDHPLLVSHGERGFLFDPKEPASIVAAIEALCRLTPEAWARLSNNARQYAESRLSLGRMVDAYEALVRSCNRKRSEPNE